MAGPAEISDLTSYRTQWKFRQEFPKTLEVGCFLKLNRLGDASVVDRQVQYRMAWDKL